MAVGFDFVEIATDAGRKAPSRVLLLRDGDLKWTDLEGAILDQASADAIISRFEEHGADLVVDYHHTAVAVERGEAEKAPAAGWIKRLSYVPGEGLFGLVEWTAIATEEIESEAYKYLSPVIHIDTKTGRIDHLHSVALVTRPRTIDAPALLEAAEAQRVEAPGGQINESHRSKPMTKAKKTKPKNMRRITAWRLLSAQEEALPGIDVDTESLPEDQVAEIDEVGDAITKLMEALNANGVNVPEGAGSVEIIALAIDAISGGGGEEDVSDEEASDDTTNATTDQVAAAMGLKRGSSLKVICGEAKAARVKMGSGSEVESRLADVETELAGYRAREQATIGSELVAAQVENGRINPNGKAHLKQCLILATEDPERFKLMYANAPVVCPPEGQLVTSSGNVPGKTDRDRVISGAAKEYDELTPGQQAQTDKPGWINVALYEGEDKPLTDTERATHKLEA